MMKRALLVAFVLSTLGVVAPARAEFCAGPKSVDSPPPGYTTGWSPPVLGYRVGTGLPAKAWIGAYYQDGYWIADVSDPARPMYKSFNAYNTPQEIRGVDVHIIGGTNPQICAHVRFFSQWPADSTGDGCLLLGNWKQSCSFFGGTRIGTAGFPPVPSQTVPVDLPGAYVAAAPNWAIYKESSSGGTEIIVGSSRLSPPGGVIFFTGANTRYYACVGTVTVSKPPASACTSGPGALVVKHL